MSKKSIRKTLSEQEKSERKLARELAKKSRQLEIARNKKKYYANLAKKQERELKSLLKAVRGKGIYDPKGNELSRYRKSRLNKISKEFGDLLDPKKFAFVMPEKGAIKKVIERAKGLELKTTKTGLFVPREGNAKVKIKRDRKRDEYYIEKSGKTKWGVNQGKRYRSVTPLASVDELDKERDRIKEMADKLGPLNKGERITFEITEKGNEGFGRATFQNINLLLDYLDQYRKTIAAKINFYRHIKIVKTETVKKWFDEHPPKAPKKFARRIHTRVLPNGRNG